MQATLVTTGKWERRSLLAGIVFVLLFIAGVGSAGDPISDDPARTAAYFADHRTRVMAGNYLAGLGLVVFLGWCWSLMTFIDRAGGRDLRLGAAVFVFGAVIAAVEFPVLAVDTALAYVSKTPIEAGLAHTLANLSRVFSYVDYFPTAAFFAAFGLAILRTGIISRWFGWSALALGGICLLAAAPSFGLDVPASLATFAWIIIATIALYRGAGQ